ncbi:butyrophilin subfamily 2 member A1-like [Anarrhichthys ocellatus]|uniref:butyrophilin subfamily 2 member A1-like n=1 Tax=Anarrhichthys ocellatus TaxID=433405 RepID=UPI0012EE967D|nr:butyrophilin subfamily 2 member A1-like [Anarrhichthys ocellatus]
MSGFKRPFNPLELLSLLFRLLTLSEIILGYEHGIIRKVNDGSDVILPCSLDTEQDISAAVFDWQKVPPKDTLPKEVFFYDAGDQYNNGKYGQSEAFKGRVSHFEDQLKHGTASIIIRNTKKEDSGTYTCHFPLLKPPQTFYIELVVELSFKDRSGEISGAAPKPFVTILHATDVWSLLQCEVRGASPKLEVEWQDSDGNKLPAEEPQVTERGGSYDITLNITATKTDRYRCVVEQEDIKRRITSETFGLICEKAFDNSLTKVIIGLLVLGIVILALLVFWMWITRSKSSRRQQGNGSDDLENGSVDSSTPVGMDQAPDMGRQSLLHICPLTPELSPQTHP